MNGRARRRRRWPTLTERILEDGRTLDDPDQEERAELTRLAEEGLIKVRWSRYFACVDHADDEDLVFASSRTCNQKIPLAEHNHPDDPYQREDDRRYECGGCGRVHWPLRRRRTLYDRATVSLSTDGVGDWLDGVLQEVDPTPATLRERVVWRVSGSSDEVHVCLLDACADTRFGTREFARSNPVVYVVIDHRTLRDRFVDADWLHVVYLHELAERGAVALREKLSAVCEGDGGPMVCREPAAPPWLPLRSPEPRVHRRTLGMHELRFLDSGAWLDGVEVLPADATGLVPVLRFLADRHHDDVVADKGREDHCLWSPREILEDLEEQGLANTQDPGTVRRQLTRIRRQIRAAYLGETGIQIGADDVVQNVPGQGYRVNAVTVTVSLA